MSLRDYLSATDRELAAWPGVRHRYESGAKHKRLILCFGEATLFVTFPTSPSDRRGPVNHIATVRRTLRQLGAARTQDSSRQQRSREFGCASRQSRASP